MKMEKRITKELILKYEKDSKGIYCGNNEAVKLIWGTATNPFDIGKNYGVQRKKGQWFIPIKALKERKIFIQDKILKLKSGLEVIKDVLK